MAETEKKESKEKEEVEEQIEEALSDKNLLKAQMDERMEKLGIKDGKLDEIIEDIHIKGFSEVQIPVTPKVNITLKTLTGEEVSGINKMLGNMEGTMAFVSGEQGMNILSYSLMAINGKPVGTNPEERRDYLVKQGEVFLGAYLARYNDLRELIQMSVQGEPVKKF